MQIQPDQLTNTPCRLLSSVRVLPVCVLTKPKELDPRILRTIIFQTLHSSRAWGDFATCEDSGVIYGKAQTWWEILRLKVNNHSWVAGLRPGASFGYGR